MATPKSKSSAAPEHHVQFLLVDPVFAPITDGRKFKATWTNSGEKDLQEQSGVTDGSGVTPVLKTKGAVLVTLEISPPDRSECKAVGAVNSRPLDKKPLVRVQLKVSAETTSAPKPTNKCETVDIREGKQKIQYVINNVTSNGNSLKDLPYLIVDADRMEVLSESASGGEKPLLFRGTTSQVATDILNCDGVQTVGLVLGNATDDPSRWKNKKLNLVLFKTRPKESGLTKVVITEQPTPGDPKVVSAAEVSPDFQAVMYGGTWAHFSRSFSIDDVKKMLPGGLTISTLKPTDMQLDYAVEKGILTTEQAEGFKTARKAKDREAKSPQRALEYTCAWADLLNPIYAGEFAEPPPPKNKMVPQIDPKTKKPTIDPDTHKPVLVPELSEAEFEEKKMKPYREQIQLGQGAIVIRPLGLTITLDPGATGNAHRSTGMTKQQILSRTHPYAYVVLLEGAATVGFHKVLLSSTWRPQLGSVLHKLGDAIDLTEIDSETDSLPNFSYKGEHVNALAKNFSDFIYKHRYAKPEKMYYIGDDYNVGTDADNRHDDHLHFTVDRLMPPAEQDKQSTKQGSAGGNVTP